IPGWPFSLRGRSDGSASRTAQISAAVALMIFPRLYRCKVLQRTDGHLRLVFSAPRSIPAFPTPLRRVIGHHWPWLPQGQWLFWDPMWSDQILRADSRTCPNLAQPRAAITGAATRLIAAKPLRLLRPPERSQSCVIRTYGGLMWELKDPVADAMSVTPMRRR